MSSSTATFPPAATPAPPPRPRRRWLRWLLWLTVFGSGFVAGTGMTLIGVRQGMLTAIHHPETMPKKAAQRLRRPLQLSDEQTQRIEQIIRARQQALNGIDPETVHTLEIKNDDPVAGILTELKHGYDLVIMGASEEWSKNTRLFGSVDDWVASHVDCSILLVRRHESQALSWWRRQVKQIEDGTDQRDQEISSPA